MKTYVGSVAIAFLLLSAACARQDAAAPAGAEAGAAMADAARARIGAARVAAGAVSPGAPRAGASGFSPSRAAALPNRGALLEYPVDVARKTGAYTWHRVAVSEAHLIDAIASGHLRLATPDGRRLDFNYRRHVEHGSGDWTWIGTLAGREGAQAILTVGADAVFGTIAQADGPPLRITMRDGATWLVETDPSAIAKLDNAATRPHGPDYHVVPEAGLRDLRNRQVRPAAQHAGTTGAAIAADPPTIDVLVGYTPGFLQAYGGQSAATTRLNYIVDVANIAYANGGIQGRLRLVHAMQVNYTDANSNHTALEELSGYEAGTGPVTPDTAFDGLRAARETYGADMVSLVRDFRDPEQEGCGVAWLLGGALQGIEPGEGWDELAYSVVGDGVDVSETDGQTYFCSDDSFAHELGHNMGAAHDRETAKGGDGTLDNPGDYGAYTYSFGYKTSATQGNFYTVMAYGDAGQTHYLTFSTPDTTFCGGYPCGRADTDNVRTLENTMPVVAGFRATVVPGGGRVRDDFDGDGLSDILWRNVTDGRNTIWLSADRSTQQAVERVRNLDFIVAAIGDFDGDGKHDIFWRNPSTGDNTIWYSGMQSLRESLDKVTGKGWRVVGAGDFNGDGQDDVLWRDSGSGKNTIWYSGHSETRLSLDPVTDARWLVVGVGDFDGDGEDDIFWNHSTTRKNTIWYSGTRARRADMKTVASTLWKAVGVGDFDGDGRDDVFWRHSTDGRNTIWRGGDGSDQQAVARVDNVKYMVDGTGDYDGDGEDDVLWRSVANGAVVLWPSADRGQREPLPTINLEWIIAP